MNQETICAISTPAGTGAIAVIRISGKNAIDITNQIFYPAKQFCQVHAPTDK